MVTPQCINGETFHATPSNYLTQLDKLQPCDTLKLAAGTYTKGLPLHNLNGEPDKPITISGPETGDPAVLLGRNCCNTVSIKDSSHLVIRHLKLDGQNNDGDGVKAEGTAKWAHHITLEYLTIVNHGKGQQIVGISTKCPAWNWIIRKNTIIGAGTGLYLGNSDGNDPFVNGVIEHNLIRDTIGYNMQIKHQKSRPSLAGMPQTGETIIRHNVFSKVNNASTGDNARPNLLVGHFPNSGAGANDRYLIYGNFFYQNTSEALFQGEGNIAFYNNVMRNDHGDAVNIQPHNGSVKTIFVFYNTIVAKAGGLRVSSGSSDFTQLVSENAVFSGSSLQAKFLSVNLNGTYDEASTFLNAPLAALGKLDLFPKSPLSGSPLAAAFTNLPEMDRDFNGSTRSANHRGAYQGGGSNPGWTLSLSLKP